MALSECDNGWGRLHACPGSYCGRTIDSDGLLSDCSSCLRGYFRSDGPSMSCSECVRCRSVIQEGGRGLVSNTLKAPHYMYIPFGNMLFSGSPNLYDWFFLLFMAGLGLTLNSFYIEYTNSKKVWQLSLLHISSVCETLAAAIVTLLLFDPIGHLTLTSCRPTSLQVFVVYFVTDSPVHQGQLGHRACVMSIY